jgi:hypothetical protein
MSAIFSEETNKTDIPILSFRNNKLIRLIFSIGIAESWVKMLSSGQRCIKITHNASMLLLCNLPHVRCQIIIKQKRGVNRKVGSGACTLVLLKSARVAKGRATRRAPHTPFITLKPLALHQHSHSMYNI